MIALGPFQLLRPLGKGGMGVVWRGVYPPQDLLVAVKVITADTASDPRYLAWFANEVRAMARLQHPNILTVLDHGVIDEASAAGSEGQLNAGSPYLVMEHASGGSIDRVDTWEELRDTLLALLDALAHAHAHGVIHRDLKPENVLLCTDEDARPGLKLADFGVAHALDQVDDEERAARSAAMGTPEFMAPEQLLGWWRELGPWTDLYALGCLAHLLCSGDPPYCDDTIPALRRAHLYQAPPEVRASFALPRGFQGWLDALMRKRPLDRFQRAADAAWALRELGDPPGSRALPLVPVPRRRLRRSGPTLVQGHTPGIDEPLARTPARTPPAAPIPEQWIRTLPVPSVRLIGAGLGLYGVRLWPLVGRQVERDALWATLIEVHETRKPALTVIRGPSGTGSSRLAAWLCARAHEVGAATPCAIDLDANTSAAEALARMAASALGCPVAERWAVGERINEVLEARELKHRVDGQALAEMIAPTDAKAAAHPLLRHRALVALLEVLLEDRPVLLLVDDVQHALDLLPALRGLFRHAAMRRLPMLVVVTAVEEALAEVPGGPEELAALTRDLGGREVRLGPLDPASHGELIERWLGLEAPLAAQVSEQTDGNPAFAIHLVQDWIERGLIEPGAHGFRVRAGARLSFPEDQRALWVGRIRTLLRGMPPAAVRFLEIAAALGTHVDEQRWTEVCEYTLAPPSRRASGRIGLSKHGARLRAELVQRLFTARLAVDDDDGWRFATAMAHAAVARLSQEAGRWADHHRTCALLARKAIDDDDRVEAWARLGRHRLHAGDVAGAIDPLLEAVRRAVDVRQRLDLIGRAELALDHEGVVASDPRRGELAWRKAEAWRVQGQLDAATDAARQLVDDAERHGWQGPLREALVTLAEATLTRGKVVEAEQTLLRLQRAAEEAHDDRHLARALFGLAGVAMFRRDHRTARLLHRKAASLFASEQAWLRMADCLRNLGLSELQAAEWTRGEQAFQRALAEYTRLEHAVGQAVCGYGLGHVARGRGHYAEAVDRLAEAARELRALGSAQALLPEVHLGIAQLQRGRVAEAGRALLTAREELAERAWTPLLCVCTAALVWFAAVSGEGWERWLAALEELSLDYVDADVLHLLTSAARAVGTRQERIAAERLLRRLEA